MRREVVEQTRRWLKKAERDIIAAEKLLEAEIYDYSLFHSQQAIEKFLKAFLTYHNKPFRKTHDVTFLLKLCIDGDESFKQRLEAEVDKLYPRAVEIRYPEVEYDVSFEEAKEAIELAEKVREFVLKKLDIDENLEQLG